YGVALGREDYTSVVETAEHGGYPLLEHLREIVQGPAGWAARGQGAGVGRTSPWAMSPTTPRASRSTSRSPTASACSRPRPPSRSRRPKAAERYSRGGVATFAGCASGRASSTAPTVTATNASTRSTPSAPEGTGS